MQGGCVGSLACDSLVGRQMVRAAGASITPTNTVKTRWQGAQRGPMEQMLDVPVTAQDPMTEGRRTPNITNTSMGGRFQNHGQHAGGFGDSTLAQGMLACTRDYRKQKE